MPVVGEESLWCVGGTHDGQRHEYVGPTLYLLPRGGAYARGWIARAAEEADISVPLPPMEPEVYVAQLVRGTRGEWHVYMEVSHRSRLLDLEAMAARYRARADLYAEQAALSDGSMEVSRIYGLWAYDCLIEARICEAQATEMCSPSVPDEPNPPFGGETDDPPQLH